MFLPIFFISLALIAYSVAIFTEKIKGRLRPWMAGVFAMGFCCDLIGTTLMVFKSKNPFSLSSVHSIFGYLALLIMFLHFMWAMIAILKRGKMEFLFHKWSIFAWIIWMLAFVSGIPK